MAIAYNGLKQVALRMRSAILYRELYEDSGVKCQFFFVNIDSIEPGPLRGSRGRSGTVHGTVTVMVPCIRPNWLLA